MVCIRLERMQTFCIPPTLSQLWENVPEILHAFPNFGKTCLRFYTRFPTLGKRARDFIRVSQLWESVPEIFHAFPNFGKTCLRFYMRFPTLGKRARDFICVSQLWENAPEILYAFPNSSDAGIIISLICYVEG